MIISTTPGFIKRNLIAEDYAVRDTSLTSPNYFNITYFPEFVGGGASLIKLRGNPNNLLLDKLTEVEILDSQGNPVRHDIPTYVDRFENYFITTLVYDSVAPGLGSVSVVGVATRDLQGNPLGANSLNENGHNVIWTRPLMILPYERNNSELVFDDPPFVSVAQVITPARVSYQQDVNQQYSAVTSSKLTINTTNFRSFDKKRGSNYVVKNGKVTTKGRDKITDERIKQISVNVNSDPLTVNSVPATTRTTDQDIVGGFIINEINRYNTTLTTDSEFFSSSYIGGRIEFFNTSYSLSPNPPSSYTFDNTNPYDELETILPATQSRTEQLKRWYATIVKVKDHNTAYIDQPVQVRLKRSTTDRTLADKITHTYQNVTNFTASVLYTPDTNLYTTSTEVSQSYLQFTLQDVVPIGGQVHKIRVYYRRGSEVGDWSLLQDQLVRPVEFLTDARYPNQTNYGYDISDYYLLGHFTQPSVITENWSVFNEQTTTFDTATGSYNDSVLLNSVELKASASINKILTTRYYQNYPNDGVFSLTFNCTLEPNTTLELYGNSMALATTVFGSDPFPRAFDKSLNYDLTRYNDRYNRFGKLIGKITNSSNTTKHYGRVVFDFKTDHEGLGRPLFRAKQIDTTAVGAAYVSEISITPRQLNGFTPKTMQFAFPAKLDTNISLSETIDYKLEYYDYTGNQSEYVTYLEDITMELATEIPTNACQSERANFDFKVLKYYACSNSDSSVYSVYMNYPQIGSASFVDPSGGGGPYAFTELPTQYPNYRYWPDWDTQNASGFNSFSEVLSKLISNYAQHIPNFDFTNTASYNAPSGLWNVSRPVFRINGDPDLATTYTPITLLNSTTSSWHYVDYFTLEYDGDSAPANVYQYAYTGNGTTSTYDGRHFSQEGGFGISRLNVSNSYYSYSIATTNNEKTEALKKRRLFWPYGGSATGSYFTENGGIYNVKFKLKKYTDGGLDFGPDSNSFMRVYLFDVSSSFTTETSGVKGWYPPPQNIVKIGNDYSIQGITVPAISFNDSATGYKYDEYNVNLIQYGTSAQLVFEACGENNAYFGIVIDDVEFCKIGVTHDPYYIAPATIASSTKFSKTSLDSQGSIPSKLTFG